MGMGILGCSYRINYINLRGKSSFAGSLNAKSFGGARFGSCCFLITIFRRGAGFERLQKTCADSRNIIDSGEKRSFVGLRWFVEAGDFPHKLQRSGPDLFRSDRRIEIVERLDVSAHEWLLPDMLFES